MTPAENPAVGHLSEQQQQALIANNPQFAQTFSLSNKLTPQDRADIVRFLQGDHGMSSVLLAHAAPWCDTMRWAPGQTASLMRRRGAGQGLHDGSAGNKVRQIVMHEETTNIQGRLFVEQIIFEMDYEQKTWKRLKRKKPIK
jgi:hypothetical protein